MSKKGRLFIISGPSGAGKSTLIGESLKDLKDFEKSISCTTRPVRRNEEKGKHYRFVTEEKFKEMIEEGKLLEWASYCDYLYGTPADFVNRKLQEGINVILEIDVQGAMQVKEKAGDAYMIFIAPTSLSEARQRLMGRGTDIAPEIEKRLAVAEQEMKYKKYYDCIIVNNNYNEALLNLKEVLNREKGRKRP
ncbi:MAG: guanylate kinase [Actinomycetota bacterium]